MTHDCSSLMGLLPRHRILPGPHCTSSPAATSQARLGGRLLVLMWLNHETGKDSFLDILS